MLSGSKFFKLRPFFITFIVNKQTLIIMRKLLLSLTLCVVLVLLPETLLAESNKHPANPENLSETLVFVVTMIIGVVIRWWEKRKLKKSGKLKE